MFSYTELCIFWKAEHDSFLSNDKIFLSSNSLSSDIISDFDLSLNKNFEIKDLIFDSIKEYKFWLKFVEKYFLNNITDP